MKVLVAENNDQMRKHLCDLLEKEGMQTLQTPNGSDVIPMYQSGKPDFICLDIMMDDVSGYDVCKEIRKHDTDTPIMFISSKSETLDKVIGLEVGADDYIVKPFDIKEVTARIRAVARRCMKKKTSPQQKEEEQFTIGKWLVIPSELRAKSNDDILELSLRDIKILKLFFENQGKVINRDMLLDHCWGAHIMPESRTVDWHISQLRKKIEDDAQNPQIIKTVHGAGYKYEQDM